MGIVDLGKGSGPAAMMQEYMAFRSDQGKNILCQMAAGPIQQYNDAVL